MAIHLSKIYTRGGDKGFTSLVGGQRIEKHSLRLESYGTTDELNSIMGILRTELDSGTFDWEKQALQWVEQIQNELFDLGSVLATAPGDSYPTMPSFVDGVQETRLETEIDFMLQDLESLKSFTIPGGSTLNAYAHLARTVCRRAERLVSELETTEPSRPETLRYLNRLSDWLFVFSRHVAKMAHKKEYLWEPRKTES